MQRLSDDGLHKHCVTSKGLSHRRSDWSMVTGRLYKPLQTYQCIQIFQVSMQFDVINVPCELMSD